MVKTLSSNARGAGSIPGREAKIPLSKKPKHKQEQYCNKSSKDFKNGPHQKTEKISRSFILLLRKIARIKVKKMSTVR